MRSVYIFVALILLSASSANSSPSVSFSGLLAKAESDPQSLIQARAEAERQNLPLNILTKERVMFDAKGIENGKVVYAVFTNLADIYNGGFTAFYDEVARMYNPLESRIDYGNGHVVDNTGGMYNPVISSFRGGEKFLMVPDWTFDRVYLFNSTNGDLLDTAFIQHSNPNLQSPKHALQLHTGRHVVVSDQISDLVQKFDTNGTYTGFYAPAGGVNTAILDNIRGIRFMPNRYLLVTVGSGASQNTIQQFDTAGNHVGAFITSNLNSPFDIMYRQGDMLVSNSSGTTRISKFTHDGVFISAFYSGTSIAFPQQMMQLANGNVIVAGFSTPSGLIIFDSTGNYIRSLTGVTGNRSVYLLGNGHYMTTNSTGVHEIDSASGALVRTIVTGANYQYVSEYVPGLILSSGINNAIAEGFGLGQNYRNPYNPATTVSFSVGKRSHVLLTVYDISGKKIATLAKGTFEAGDYETVFDAGTVNSLPSGVYLYRLTAGSFSETKRMTLLK